MKLNIDLPIQHSTGGKSTPRRVPLSHRSELDELKPTKQTSKSRNPSMRRQPNTSVEPPPETSMESIKSKNQKLADLSEKILRLNGGETLGKYFRTRLESDRKGGLIARV